MIPVLALTDLQVSPTAARFEGRPSFGVELSFFVTNHPPGVGPELHFHPYSEVFLVQDGQATFTVGDEQVTVSGGHVLTVPPNTHHRFENTGEALLRVVGMHLNGEVVQTAVEA